MPKSVQPRLRRYGLAVLLSIVAVALTLVVVAPAVLSSSDILRWATSPDGLHLTPGLAWLAFIALDAAAVVCVGMSTFSAAHGESGGAFRCLTWAFAAGSAIFNYRFGLTTAAPDDQVFFPAMSLAGPVLLEAMLKRIRTWRREADGVQRGGRPRFGLRWIVAFKETRRAWLAAVREGITRADEAVVFVRETQQLATLSPHEQLIMAWQALGTTDVMNARHWLAARGSDAVTSEAVERALVLLGRHSTLTAARPARELAAASGEASGDRSPERSRRRREVRVGVSLPAVNDLADALRRLGGDHNHVGEQTSDRQAERGRLGVHDDRRLVREVVHNDERGATSAGNPSDTAARAAQPRRLAVRVALQPVSGTA